MKYLKRKRNNRSTGVRHSKNGGRHRLWREVLLINILSFIYLNLSESVALTLLFPYFIDIL